MVDIRLIAIEVFCEVRYCSLLCLLNNLWRNFRDRLRLCYFWGDYWLYRGYCAFGSGCYGRGYGNCRLDPDFPLFF
jgi:hypothetical protein